MNKLLQVLFFSNKPNDIDIVSMIKIKKFYLIYKVYKNFVGYANPS